MKELVLVKSFRPDRFVQACQKLVNVVLGNGFNADKELDLAKIVESEVNANTPVLMCSVAGFDASGRVDDLSAELGKPMTSIAIGNNTLCHFFHESDNYKTKFSYIIAGSEEGFAQAEKAINTAAKNGRWVLLKNVHLAPSWLVTLEKKLHSLTVHPGFRLFLTCEITPKLPVNLLRAGRIFTFEPPPGVKANLVRTFNTIPPGRMMAAPNERAR